MTETVTRTRVTAPRAFLSWLSARPFAIALAATMTVVGTGALLSAGRGVRPSGVFGTNLELVAAGHWWALLSFVLVTRGIPALVIGIVATVVLVGASERVMGTLRAIIAAIVGTLFAAIVGGLLQGAAQSSGELWAQHVGSPAILDPLVVVITTLAAASAFMAPLWRRRARLLLVLFILSLLLYEGQVVDIYRACALVGGLTVGVLMRGRRNEQLWRRSSSHEIRVLASSSLLVVALGPVISLVGRARYGLLAPMGLIASAPSGQGGGRCDALSVTSACVRELVHRPTAVGPQPFTPALILLFVLIAAYGLVRGRRFAAMLSVGVLGVLGAVVLVTFGLVPLARVGEPFVARYWEVSISLLFSALVPTAIAIALFILRRHFPVRVASGAYRRFGVRLMVAWFVIIAGYIAAVAIPGGPLSEGANALDVLRDAVYRVIPVGLVADIHLLPSHSLASGIAQAAFGPLLWAITLVLMVPLVVGSRIESQSDGSERARALVSRGGGDSRAFMATWPGNRYWFDNRGSCVAYRVVGDVAITTGSPFGSPEAGPEVMGEFARYCDDSGWTPVFYAVDAHNESWFAEQGWSTLTVAEETVIRPQKWATTGKKWQDVRTSINRAARAGVTAVWTTYDRLTTAQRVQIAEISDGWVTDKGLPEMGFTLGGLTELRDPDVRLMMAVDEDGRIDAVTSWLPTFDSGHVVGWTLDFMRRRADSANGVMEFLIAESAMRFKADGVELMSLSASPLSHTAQGDESDDATVVDQLLARMSHTLEPMYGFRSLFRFKQKFQPELHRLVMAYPDPFELPAIGLALVRAYFPGISLRKAMSLARKRVTSVTPTSVRR